MGSPASEMMSSKVSRTSRTPVSRSMSSGSDLRSDASSWMALEARNAPAVGSCFAAGVIGNNAALVGRRKQGVRLCLLVQFENVGSDEVAEYPEQDDDYDDEMQVRL